MLLHFDFEEASAIPGIDPTFQPEINVWAEFVYLDGKERRECATGSHEYLIEQTAVFRDTLDIGAEQNTHTLNVPFSGSVKFLAWVVKPSEDSHGIFSASMSGLETRDVCGPLAQCELVMDGRERFEPRKGSYFRLCHPLRHFGRAPSVGVYAYSFALNPTQLAPSGSLDFRMKPVHLKLTTKAAVLGSAEEPSLEDETLASAKDLKVVEVYARTLNKLHIKDGYAGLGCDIPLS